MSTTDRPKPTIHTTGNPHADGELNRIRRELGDRWEVWATRGLYMDYSYSAKPTGALVAVLIKSDPDTLIEAAIEYEESLTAHLDDTRQRHADATQSDARRVLAELVIALEHLQSAITSKRDN